MRDNAMRIKWSGIEYLANRENTILFTFFGELAVYNHVYLIPERINRREIGGYVWSDNKIYQPVVDFIVANCFAQRLNSNDVANEDLRAFAQAHPAGLQMPDPNLLLPKGTYDDLKDLYFTDSFPEDWENG